MLNVHDLWPRSAGRPILGVDFHNLATSRVGARLMGGMSCFEKITGDNGNQLSPVRSVAVQSVGDACEPSETCAAVPIPHFLLTHLVVGAKDTLDVRDIFVVIRASARDVMYSESPSPCSARVSRLE